MSTILVDIAFFILFVILAVFIFLWDWECWRSAMWRRLWRKECKHNNKIFEEVLMLRFENAILKQKKRRK